MTQVREANLCLDDIRNYSVYRIDWRLVYLPRPEMSDKASIKIWAALQCARLYDVKFI